MLLNEISSSALSGLATERRMQRVSKERLPTTSKFHPYARILCVGHNILYRVVMNIVVHPVGHTVSETHLSGKSHLSWSIVVSHVKFHQFITIARSILNSPAIREILVGHYQMFTPYGAFVRALYAVMNHFTNLNSAFVVHDNCYVMNQNRCYFEGFIAELWNSMELILPSIAVETHVLLRQINGEIRQLHMLVCEFLAVPETKILEASYAYTSAIMSLEDIEVLLPRYMDQQCSICLESLLSIESTTAFVKEKDRNDPCKKPLPSAVIYMRERSHSVRSPCGHIFHENCIMSWFRQSATCPECRASVSLKRQ
ncbi:unnamed protein product [Albugo candida]|uniref:RING-type domain-containing protein n=1 Tax=Albugo candida TaxID=65357 RepID=A0A024GJZ5_9STRA|nr:unnamed protein product [Albugo candida]|eukprot:CCI47038.1 unnamed protein product [Albugo candida]